MMSQEITLITYIDNHRTPAKPKALQFGEEQADVLVQILDRRVVGGNDALLLFFAEVSEDGRDPPFVVGSYFWKRHVVRFVTAGVLDREVERRMRFPETDP